MPARVPLNPRSATYNRIYAVVRRIPKGRVASYGQVARLSGLGNHARQVGYALHQLPDDSGVPWQRVVNHRGEVSARAFAGMEQVQRALLEAEGVSFGSAGRIDLTNHQWRPREKRSPASGDGSEA
jgi:methylated-DNA-protein-cysteine methyltransferase-like protein